MNVPPPHLNLLRPEERKSPSPVRLRVMLPALAALACAACAVWWGALLAQRVMVGQQAAQLEKEIAARRVEHDAVLARMDEERRLRAELGQLETYAAGRRTYGALFARLAETVPADVQLLQAEIPEAPFAATNAVEAVSLRLWGRTPKETPLMELMAALERGTFTNTLVTAKGAGDAMSPRIHSFRQEATAAEGQTRLLTFDVEYRCRERRFGP